MDVKLINLKGGCLCGAIRYQVNAKPFDADYCHCRQCQLSSGAVVMSWMDFKAEQLVWLKGQTKEFSSSDKVRRGFCQDCGCSLSYRHIDYPDYVTLSIASLDEPNQVSPNYHIYTVNQVSWLNIDDNCKRYKLARSETN
ncbi:GFA family protein [Shewanella aestuarii]|uniref:GFA family protein n=1 Tax=Shewanella aestuarii TaxID=1028752 RepID=A0A6G9QKH8_9GAMM|nr:GFA family protein [Shewanella aestuarii]QIR14888.1 GFA family protein [Shewanella aestuarii]